MVITLIEAFLIVGLLCILLFVILLHFSATSKFDWVQDITGVPPEPSLHPAFFSVEAILGLTIFYLFVALFS